MVLRLNAACVALRSTEDARRRHRRRSKAAAATAHGMFVVLLDVASIAADAIVLFNQLREMQSTN